MIYLLLFWEFFKIGLFAIGGGLVTVPFLFDLAEKYSWFTTAELADMIAVSQSTPGPVGINMATYAGFKVAGLGGALLATFAEVLPSVIIIYLIARILVKWNGSSILQQVLTGIRPAVMALILFAGWDIAREARSDYKSALTLLGLLITMRLYKTSAIFYIIVSAVIGVVLQI